MPIGDRPACIAYGTNQMMLTIVFNLRTDQRHVNTNFRLILETVPIIPQQEGIEPVVGHVVTFASTVITIVLD